MIPPADTTCTANTDPSTGPAPPQRDPLDPNVSILSATQPDTRQGVTAVADNTPVTKKINVSVIDPIDDSIDHLSSTERDNHSNRNELPPRIHAANKEGTSSPTILYDLGKVSSVSPRSSYPTPKNQETSTGDIFEDNVPVNLYGDDRFSRSKHQHGAPLDIKGYRSNHDIEVTSGIFPDAKNPSLKKGDSPRIGAKLPPKDNKTTFDDASTRRNEKDHPSPLYDLGASSSTKRSTKISKRAHSLFARIPAYSQNEKKTATSNQQLINTSRSLSYSGKGDKGENVNKRDVTENFNALEINVESQKPKIQESEEAKKIHTNNGLHDRADETMVVKLSDFDALKMKLEELEVSQRNQTAEIESQKRRIHDLEASHEQVRALIPVEIPHGADNSLPTTLASVHSQSFLRRRMSSTFRNYHIVSNSGNGDDDENGDTLESDTFSMMMISKVWSRSWALGLVAFLFQIVLGAMIAFDQNSLSADSSIFGVPFKVKPVVRVGQFLTIILCLLTQSDILTSVQSVLLLGKGSGWDEVIGETGHKSTSLWIIRILVPNLLKLTQGLLVTFVSFVIIIQSDNIINLLKDFTALMVLSETDNVLFDLASYGYLGQELMDQVAKVSNIKVPKEPSAATDINPMSLSSSTRMRRKLHSAFCILHSLFSPSVPIWVYAGRMDCNCGQNAFELAKKHFGDGSCYGGPLNSLECAFEGGDCIDFNIAYPLCKGRSDLIDVQSSVGNGTCEELFMIPECDFDGGDCCPLEIIKSPLFGDNRCHGGMFNTARCNFDNGDCDIFNAAYPECPLSQLGDIGRAGEFMVRDDVCDGIYSSVECGWENGDCDIGQVGQDLDVVIDSHMVDSLLSRSSAMGIFSDGHVSLYHYNDVENRWHPLGKLSSRGEEAITTFAMALNHAGGDRIAISSFPFGHGEINSSFIGQVEVYDYVALDQTWVQVGQNITEEELGSAFGLRLDMTANGSRLVISAPQYGDGVGRIYIYELNMAENRWKCLGNTIEGKSDMDAIGYSFTHVSADDGNTVIFSSALGHFDKICRIYRYNQASQDWIQLGSDVPSPYAKLSAISSNGTRIAVPSNTVNEDARGEVKVFDFDEMTNSWRQVGTTIVSAQSGYRDGFGYDVAMSSDGGILAISSVSMKCENCATGKVQIFLFDANRNEFIPANPKLSQNSNAIVDRDRDRANTQFGWHLSMSGDGSTLSITGSNFIDKQGFVRVYNLDQLFYMGCWVDNPSWLGDGSCFDWYPYNSAECGFEDGDCPLPSPVEGYPGCMVSDPDKIGDGKCIISNALMYNTTECGYDGGDCLPKPVEGYPSCNLLPEHHELIGNGDCDEWQVPTIRSTECGYDGGDCPPPGCHVPAYKFGDGECDVRRDPSYNSTECNYDGGDCLPKPVEGYPGCNLLPEDHDRIGDGYCDDWRDPSYNSTKCGFDGGDCLPTPVWGYPGCNLLTEYHDRIGDRECDDWRDPSFNSTECNYDGGDCLPKPVWGYPGCNLFLEDHESIGNGECDDWRDPSFNSTECNYDDGDCLLKPVWGYPGCLVPMPELIGNGECDVWRGPSYNSTECNYDGRDCLRESAGEYY